ncbi:unknown protein encoded by prophage CP-933K [Escherichia coli O157:H7 str. EDL933]|uniref:Uncharacterized protein n=1 Tax=Escherichia coli O157:H7 TaxID=83334 RepID=Q8X3X0_ECO57|nr:unknown protein encoded by prophage CP-933K [Escherichia coli O157:H7 str. EDL933]ACT70699.1 hypothetical protein ECSP_0840 [Escherichia coli O157:H7 str. TW14359]
MICNTHREPFYINIIIIVNHNSQVL